MASGWWDNLGAISGCLAAYQPIGAASLAASYTNKANPGTYDVGVGVDPAFDAATGWSFNGTTQYLYAPLALGANWTVMMRTALDYAFAGSNLALFGMRTSSFEGMKLRYDNGIGVWVGYYGSLVIFTGVSPASAVFTVAGGKVYQDSTQLGTGMTGSLTGTIGGRIGISCDINNINAVTGYMKQRVAAFAVYNVALSASDIATVSAAMNALTAATITPTPIYAAQLAAYGG